MPNAFSGSYSKTGTFFESAARTAHAASEEKNFSGCTDLRVGINISAFSGTSITFTVQYYSQSAEAWQTLLATSALSATGLTTLEMGLHQTTASNAKLQCVLPTRIRVLPSGTITSVTYKVAYTAI